MARKRCLQGAQWWSYFRRAYATLTKGWMGYGDTAKVLMSVVVAGVTFTRMVQYFGPVRTTMITALVPGLSAFGAVFLLGEPLYWNLAAGLALVTLGILFGVRAVPATAAANGAMAPPVVARPRVG